MMNPDEIRIQDLTEIKNTVANEMGYPDFEKLVHCSGLHDIDIAISMVAQRYAEVQRYPSFHLLGCLQREFGYQPGILSPVAIFGLFGEAGEVLNEVYFPLNKKYDEKRAAAVVVAEVLDNLKKDMRFLPAENQPEVHCSTVNYDKFDLELADLLYYINLCALGRNKTLDYYAQLSVEKVKAKALKAPKTEEN